MKLFSSLFLIFLTGLTAPGQQQPNLQLTPFGVRELPGPPPQPAPQQPAAPAAQPQPATPAPAPAQPAAAQPAPEHPEAQPGPVQQAKDVVPFTLLMNNADIYGVSRIICDSLGLN